MFVNSDFCLFCMIHSLIASGAWLLRYRGIAYIHPDIKSLICSTYLLPSIDLCDKVIMSIVNVCARRSTLYGSTFFVILRMLPFAILHMSQLSQCPICPCFSWNSLAVIFCLLSLSPAFTPLKSLAVISCVSFSLATCTVSTCGDCVTVWLRGYL